MTTENRKTKGQASEVDIYVGKKLRELRNCKNMSQEALADKIGITFQQVQKYERGTNRIAAGRLYRIMLIFKVPADYFFPEYPDKQPPISPTQMKILKYFEGANDGDIPNIKLASKIIRKAQ